MKRKAAPDSFNYGGKEDASEPETKPAPKKRKPTTARNNTNGSKAPAGKKSNGKFLTMKYLCYPAERLRRADKLVRSRREAGPGQRQS